IEIMFLKIRYGWICVLIGIILQACLDANEDLRAAPTRFVSATPVVTWPAAQLNLLVQYSGTGLDPALVQNGARVYQISYKTSYKGQEIEASGLVVLPETKESVPMISFHRGTIVEYADAPSMQSRNSEE